MPTDLPNCGTTRNIPFAVDDHVEITNGELGGCVGTIIGFTDYGRCIVRVGQRIVEHTPHNLAYTPPPERIRAECEALQAKRSPAQEKQLNQYPVQHAEVHEWRGFADWGE